MIRDELRESLALLPCHSDPWIWVTKPRESGAKKFIGRQSAATAPLSVKGPAKNKLCRTIMVSSHPSDPMVDERRLSDPSPGNDRNQVEFLGSDPASPGLAAIDDWARTTSTACRAQRRSSKSPQRA